MFNALSSYVYVKLWYALQRHQKLCLFLLGIALVIHISSEPSEAFTSSYNKNDSKFGRVCKAILDSHRLEYGALLTSIAGIGAIVASAMGGFKMAWGLLVVSIGSFILQEYKDMWFNGTCG